MNLNKPQPKVEPRPIDTIPEWIFERSRSNGILPDHVQWLVKQYGAEAQNFARELNLCYKAITFDLECCMRDFNPIYLRQETRNRVRIIYKIG